MRIKSLSHVDFRHSALIAGLQNKAQVAQAFLKAIRFYDRKTAPYKGEKPLYFYVTQNASQGRGIGLYESDDLYILGARDTALITKVPYRTLSNQYSDLSDERLADLLTDSFYGKIRDSISKFPTFSSKRRCQIAKKLAHGDLITVEDVKARIWDYKVDFFDVYPLVSFRDHNQEDPLMAAKFLDNARDEYNTDTGLYDNEHLDKLLATIFIWTKLYVQQHVHDIDIKTQLRDLAIGTQEAQGWRHIQRHADTCGLQNSINELHLN